MKYDKLVNVFNEFKSEQDRLRDSTNYIFRRISISKNIKTSVYLIPKSGRRGLLIELTTPNPISINVMDSKGFIYSCEKNVLKIEESGQGATSVFLIFLADILNCDESSETNYLKEINSKIHLWKEFFQNSEEKYLSQNEIIGLYGELLFIEKLLDSNISFAFSMWKGPESGRNDFVFNNLLIEVKSTTTKNPVKFKVSGERQLTEIAGTSVYISLYEIVLANGGETLSKIIQRIKNKLDIAEGFNFLKKLALVGFKEEDDFFYKKIEMRVISNSFFEVRPNFPHISYGKVPMGIVDVSYSVLKDSCKDFEISSNQLMETIIRNHS